MTRYIAIVEKEKKTLWGAWFPDCPGCVTAAGTMEGAVSQAGDALRLWAESILADGGSLPKPRGLDALRKDSDVAAALAQGNAAVIVPLLLDRGRSVRANVSFNAGLLDEIDAAAKARGLTRSAFLASAAADKIAAA